MAANYPGADPSFATKNAGDTVQAAHVNALQDEVVAIGAALRGTLTHKVTTSQTLEVTGASTFTGQVTFSTFASAIVQAVRVTHSTSQNVAHNTFTGLSWDTETVDNAGMHSTSANSSRITFADSTGIYAIGATTIWPANSSGAVAMRILRNDATPLTGLTKPTYNGGIADALTVAALISVSSTADYVTVQVLQDSGSTRSVDSTNAYGETHFWAYKVSR